MHQEITKKQRLLENLKRKHNSLDKQIEMAYSESYTNDSKITEMKKQKLYLKDQLTKLETRSKQNG